MTDQSDSTTVEKPLVDPPPSDLLTGEKLHELSLAPSLRLPLNVPIIPIFIVGSVVWLGVFSSYDFGMSQIERVVMMACFPALMVAVVIRHHLTVRERVGSLYDALKPAYDEVVLLHERLSEYLSNLDRRTSRFFHAVTHSKVSAYFSLSQIRDRLSETVEDLAPQFDRPTREGMKNAFETLRGTLTFSDGAMPKSGHSRSVPFSQIVKETAKLVATLEEGIAELESEIKASDDAIYQGQNRDENEES